MAMGVCYDSTGELPRTQTYFVFTNGFAQA